MPSWVECHLEITGPVDEIDLFTGMALGDGERDYLEFNNLYPLPEDLDLEKNSATELIYKAKYGSDSEVEYLLDIDWIKKLNVSSRTELIQFAIERADPEGVECAERYKANIDKYGVTTWKDWCIQNWGTKWSAQQVRVTSNPVFGISTLSTVHYHFNTIWSPPVPLFKVVAQDYKKLEFLLEYKNPDENYSGRLLVRHGQLVQDERKVINETEYSCSDIADQ